MQIQIPNHSIKESNQININDIPLAYINTDDSKLTRFYNKCWGLRKFSGSNIYFFAKK